MSSDHRMLAYVFVLTLLLLAWMAVAAGETAPEFPFQNVSQLGGLPGWDPTQPITEQPCLAHQAAVAVLANPARTQFWVIFVQLDGLHVTGGFYEVPEQPAWIYQGTYNRETGQINIAAIRPFVDQGPCSEWGLAS